jgi:hypothetical protein
LSLALLHSLGEGEYDRIYEVYQTQIRAKEQEKGLGKWKGNEKSHVNGKGKT